MTLLQQVVFDDCVTRLRSRHWPDPEARRAARRLIQSRTAADLQSLAIEILKRNGKGTPNV